MVWEKKNEELYLAGTETEWEMNIFVCVSFGGGLDLVLVLCKELNSEWFERKKMLID